MCLKHEKCNGETVFTHWIASLGQSNLDLPLPPKIP